MAGVKHFYVGTYVEGSTPGDPSEYYKLIWEAQQAFKYYFATEKAETDAEIMFVQSYTNYNTGYDEVPLSIGTRTGDRRDTYGGMPRYCQNLVYTSLAWERHRGTMTFAHRNYYHAPINISPVRSITSVIDNPQKGIILANALYTTCPSTALLDLMCGIRIIQKFCDPHA